ncbi:hypothetical protein EXIGLDRAFT_659885 [Exidia glandulosa HHB12029]|uniref:Non-ribosomal peptide synthetase n=1 Tax=Exidia glandulosa HHB12029 TaxID=1314781 RepID=A0A165Z853_EXIGL|nr:hypothetical protein EXIGLDRAFT_659885 [Exidia glandulosa HHB12029]
MSHMSDPRADAHDDAEKGLSEVVLAPLPLGPPALTHVASSSSFIKSGATTAVGTPTEKSHVDLPKLVDEGATAPKASPPAKKSSPPAVSRWIRFRIWFNMYRKFFTFVLTFNMIGVILAATGNFNYAVGHIGALVLGNLLFAILMRNELFGRFLYLVINTLFAKWTPLWFRLGCTSVLQHLGGIHSGCATSGVIWLIYKVVDIFVNHDVNHDAVLVMGVLTNIAVIVSIISAFPWVRNTHHNAFERYHRFVGWIGLAFTWVFVVLGDTYNPDTREWDPSGGRLLSSQEFWFVIGMTIFILLPWLFVREVAVEVEIPSPKVAILRFERGMQQGLLARISRSSIMEYHAFGIISEGTHAKHHYLICGVQGDFTRGLVNNPPTRIWTRELKFAGVSNTSTLYKRGIRICTGTGLGAALSTCIQSPNWFLIWIGSDQEKTFGPTISNLIYSNIEPERRILWDSKKEGGRPDTMKLVRETYEKFNAEVVFITSNWQGNKEIMEGCKVAKIPAFGTLWDF